MAKILNISQILVYYDFPEIFLAKDIVETNYLCLLVDANETATTYISTAISQQRLSAFINGQIDLRDIYTNPEIEEWLIFNQVDQIIVAEKWNEPAIPEIYLPEPGFVFQKQLQGLTPEEIEIELKKSDAMEKVSKQIIDVSRLVLDASNLKFKILERGYDGKNFNLLDSPQ